MIRGVIFDMDGLMFDTERIWATLWKPALHSLGMEYKEGLAEAIRGTAGESSRRVLRQFYGADCDAEAIHAALHREADRAFTARPDKKPGLDELLAWLDAHHIPMAVASSSRMAADRYGAHHCECGSHRQQHRGVCTASGAGFFLRCADGLSEHSAVTDHAAGDAQPGCRVGLCMSLKTTNRKQEIR